MTKPTFQIDLKPVTPKEQFTSYHIKLYINGNCFTGIVPLDQVRAMVHEGLVHQTYGIREEGNGTRIRFEYPDKVDGAGVQYTSDVYEMEIKKYE